MSKPEGYNTLKNEHSPILDETNVSIHATKKLRYASTEPYNDALPKPVHDPDDDETPQDGGLIIHVAPEPNMARWTHIEDLDSFFLRMYCYHQKHGFNVMILAEFFSLAQFVFVIFFTTFLWHCVDYQVLFKEKPPDSNHSKVTISDVVLDPSECISSLGVVAWTCLCLAGFCWLLRLARSVYHLAHYWDIKHFFNIALKIDDVDLDNLTWHEVQKRVRDVQSEQQMCIHKAQLTELDIYHRILRFKNYMVAMINKSLLPVKFQVPFIGETIFLSHGLKENMEFLLFWGPWSPFENNWHLRDDYKKSAKRNELAADLSKHIMYVALANLILCPLVFLWQLMFLFFNYGEMIKREPGTLGARAWSQYARLYLRHFNELDHELNARLTRAYRPAVRYISAFSSPLMTVIARNIAFIAGGVLATLLILTVYDEDVLAVEHVLSIMTILGAVVATCRLFIPDENLVWCPEQLLAGVLAHVHYLPASWRGYAHTTSVRDSFSQLFQYKAVYLFYELISPLTTPFILLFWLRPKALDIVDFYRNFTVAVVGVGDVCSFAQMDVRKHGNPDWQTSSPNESQVDYGGHAKPTVNQYTQGEHGKTELSLLHFALTNPDWAMPHEAHRFVSGLRRGAMHELRNVNGNQGTMNLGAMGFSLNTLSSLGEEYASIANSILVSNYKLPGTNNLYAPGFSNLQEQSISRIADNEINMSLNDLNRAELSEIQPDTSMVTPAFNTSMLRRGLNRVEGNIGGNSSLLLNLQCNNSLGASVFGQGNTISRPLSNTGNPLESNIADMSLSTLYLHEMHHRQLKRRVGWNEQRPSNIWSQSQNLSSDIQNTSLRNQPSTSTQRTVECEKMPLLSVKKS